MKEQINYNKTENTENSKNNEIDYLKQEIENINTRINNSFWHLIWKEFQEWEIIQLKYKTLEWNNVSYSFDTTTNKITINDKVFSITYLEWVKIKKIEFTENKVIIHWLFWMVEWKLESTYTKTLNSIDEIYKYINK